MAQGSLTFRGTQLIGYVCTTCETWPPSVASAYRQVVPGVIEVPYQPHADVNPVALLPMSGDFYPVLPLGDSNG